MYCCKSNCGNGGNDELLKALGIINLKMNKAYNYAKQSIRAKEVPKYVKKQCREFLRIADGKDDKYFLDETRIKQIENVLKLLIMPKSLKSGQTLYECSTKYQWLFYVSVLCIVHRDNPNKRKYETAILEICRKNFKTFTVATMFILLFLLEPKYSKFYSVAPDGSLSREVKTAILKSLERNGFSPTVINRLKVCLLPVA